ncbi:MAG TPA: hypothetical protein ENG65_00710 [Candidatus Bathyarchaeota archaeon]|nr:hypothetical protein [Candidatus Bathyarchaeota archaeon]
MSILEERRIRCPSCGRMVPAMRYCIYCGAKLPKAPQQIGGLQPRPQQTAPIITKPMKRSFFPGAKDEIEQLMSRITVMHERKAALLDFFISGEVSEKVFIKLYKEYSGKLNDYLKVRMAKLEELKGSLQEKKNLLSDIAMKLEEIEIRTKVGEIDAATYNRKVEELRDEERRLSESINSLNADIRALENIFGDKRPSELRDLEIKLEKLKSSLEKMGEEGKVTQETLNFVMEDLEKTLKLLDSLLKDRKEREMRIREQLETLQTRYKLSELSIEEYERRKRELQAEIDKIWE